MKGPRPASARETTEPTGLLQKDVEYLSAISTGTPGNPIRIAIHTRLPSSLMVLSLKQL